MFSVGILSVIQTHVCNSLLKISTWMSIQALNLNTSNGAHVFPPHICLGLRHERTKEKEGMWEISLFSELQESPFLTLIQN